MPQNYRRYLVLSILPILFTGFLEAQVSNASEPQYDSLARYIQMKYGLDQDLFNGFQYYERLLKYVGDPYFPENTFYEGSISIKGNKYDDVRLKYNSYSQSLILEYTDYQERYNQLRLNNAQIDSFQLGALGFQKLSLFGEESMFYQVLNSGAICCFIHWEKEIHATTDDLQYSHEYSRPLAQFYLSYQDSIHSFSNRKSFISIFPDPMQVEIRKYFRRQGFSFRELDPEEIQMLIDFAGQLDYSLSEP